jgi:hypothetical protein
VEVINQFLIGVLRLRDAQLELPFFGVQDDRLVVHAAHHVEGRPGLPPQRQLQEVVLDAGFQRLLELALDLEEPIRRTEPPDTLMGAFMVVVLQPEFDALARLLKTLELSSGQELPPDRGPEPFDLPQGHRMMRTALDMGHPIFPEFGFEPAHPTPGGVLPPVIGEHLLGRLILPSPHPIHLDHRVGRRAPEQIRPGDEPGVIVQEGDQIRILAPQPEGKDVALPHLVGRGPLEEPRPGQVPLPSLPARGLHQPSLTQPIPHCLRTGRQKVPSPQPLADPSHPKLRVLLLQRQNLLGDGRR